MKFTLKHVLAAIVLMLSVAAPVAAGPLKEANAAYNKGNYQLALQIIRPLAEHGDAEAQVMLGFLYQEGEGTPQDYPEAVKWYRLAAEQGNAMGQTSLGSMYVSGRGVPQDSVEAVKWFRRAADQGDGLGQSWLGSMYKLGMGVPQDDVAAHMWLNLAAAQSGEAAVESRESRDKIAKRMTPAQIAQAQKLAREWKPTK